jgi:hypothetical protein
LFRFRPLPDNTIGGDISVGGKPVAGAIVYLPEIVDVTLTDKMGFFSFSLQSSEKRNVTVKVRSTQLANGGFDIPTQTGTYIEARTNEVYQYNPQRCPESDKLMPLYNAALHIRYIWRLALADHKRLLPALQTPDSRRQIGRAIRRTQYHAQHYMDISALMPDRQLLCSTKIPQCVPLDLMPGVRLMRQIVQETRRESALFNRQLRQKGRRSDKQSVQVIKTIRNRSERAWAAIKKLARTTYSCTTGTATIQPAADTPKAKQASVKARK